MKDILFNLISKNFSKKNKIKIINIYCFFHKIIYPKRFFEFNGHKIKYYYAPYNMTFLNERSIEIPIALSLINKYKTVLEIGNVLNHYISIKHDVLDKYEKYKDVINKDILNFYPRKKYDLIISISTIEHIGFDEKIKDTRKTLKSLIKIKSLLSKNGIAYITFILGYNKYLDNYLLNNKLPFKDVYLFERSRYGNKWSQLEKSKKPYSKCLVVGIIR